MLGPDRSDEVPPSDQGTARWGGSGTVVGLARGGLPDTISDPGEEGGVDAPNEGDDEPEVDS